MNTRLGGGVQYNDKQLDEVARRVAFNGLRALEAQIGSANRDAAQISALSAAVDAAASFVQDDDDRDED